MRRPGLEEDGDVPSPCHTPCTRGTYGSSQPNGSCGLPPSRRERAKYLLQVPVGRCRACQCRRWHPPVFSSLTRNTNDTAINLLAQTGKRFCRESSPPEALQADGSQVHGFRSVCAHSRQAPCEGSPRKCHRHGGIQGPGASCMHRGPGESKRRRSHTTAAGVCGVRAATAGS